MWRWTFPTTEALLGLSVEEEAYGSAGIYNDTEVVDSQQGEVYQFGGWAEL
jgi:hypothetical protein